MIIMTMMMMMMTMVTSVGTATTRAGRSAVGVSSHGVPIHVAVGVSSQGVSSHGDACRDDNGDVRGGHVRTPTYHYGYILLWF